ncbi:MAG: phage holin family protein [Bacillota bacterium]|nr:phage holin family protein [Bacillota bacterium]MDP4171601.1 phage holin family protein [Bacillota bacterium]
MKWLVGIFINAILFMAIAGYFSTSFHLAGFTAALEASMLLSILNVLVRPILIILTLPVTILTLGFFLFVINAVTLMLTDRLMGSAFNISGFGMALFVTILMAIANVIVQKTILKSERD